MDEELKLADLKADPNNRRQRTARSSAMLEDALREVGASRSIVIDEAGEILAGNGVVEAASAVGLARVKVVDVDGDVIVAVRRRNLTPEQKRALSIYDNRTAELAEWKFDQLQADAAAGLLLEPWWTADEQAELLHQVPAFSPVNESEQSRLDQRAPIICPHCGASFVPEV